MVGPEMGAGTYQREARTLTTRTIQSGPSGNFVGSIAAMTASLRNQIGSSNPSRSAIESVEAETPPRHPEVVREIAAIPRGFGESARVNPHRRRRLRGSTDAAARIYLCCQVGRFGFVSRYSGARHEAIERSVGQEILGASESTNWVLSSRLRTLPVALRGSTSTIAMS